MQQDHETVFPGNPVHKVHHELVLVVGEVGFPIDRSQFELVGGNFIMTGLKRDAETIGSHLQVTHEGSDARRNGREIVVVELLVPGGTVAEQGTSRDHQIGTSRIKRLIHKEILLFPSKVGIYLRYGRVEQTTDRNGGIAYCLEGALERHLVVQRFACVGYEYRRDTERIVQYKDRRCRIPCSVAASLECGTDPTARERRCIRLLLSQHRAVEGFDYPSLAIIIDKGVMFLSCALRKRLEPMCDMSHSVLHRPFLHPAGYAVCRLAVQRFASFYAGKQRLECV